MSKKLNVHVELDDGQVFDTTSRTADYVKYELAAKRNGWGGVMDNPSIWEGYICYSACLRSKMISMPWERFLEVVDVCEATPVQAPAEPDAVEDGFPKELSVASS